MKRIIAVAALVVLALPGHAQTYKWKDSSGRTNYGDRPPSGVSAEQVLEPFDYPANPDACKTIQCQLERVEKSKPAAEKVRTEAAPQPSLPAPPREARGLAFDTYIHLRRGMTEGEVLSRAGAPDVSSADGVDEVSQTLAGRDPQPDPRAGRSFSAVKITQSRLIKTYTYLPTSNDPFTTIITFRGGLVDDIQRIKKF